MGGCAADTVIENETTLRALYPPPRYLQIWDRLDPKGRQFIARSPLLIIGSARPDRGIDLSPRGGPPGFVRVPDAQTLIIPDRAGNNRLDTMSNLLADRRVGVLFLIPGVATILRIKGVTRLERDPQDSTGDHVHDSGKLAIVVTIRSAFIHCPRALHHSRLWDADYRASSDPAMS
ncbi:pyridoxamine 5'-phosphate oxidase family protein [Acidiphilium iwatense]|uniref:Pyridoxamine 5'-phosphate oxidase family protein n=1 Tax=Acidiphilium iwatense TaxID=768198 RepID=A0ABS9DSB5_9PROT|nr:pyridoxamine 5'-phosphate oxidase family protein [Acidiphilium iwatense]MCF3945634.1 pyridoxamine 5'-phosphate oxidase family protein [Acidiphilium iwatense]